MKKAIYISITIFLTLFLLSSCLPGDGKAGIEQPAGFFWGIWHGWMAPLSLILSLFHKNYHIYEIYNTGFWYDLGYYAAILGGFGGLQLTRKKNKHHRDD